MSKQPFNPKSTVFTNLMLDEIMPTLSGNAWKVLCLCMRKTEGWRDASTESGRKESDVISLSQFMDYCGIKSEVTVREAIDDCIKKGYLIRVHDGVSFRYRMNKVFDLDTPPHIGVDTPTENMGVEAQTPTENIGNTPTENMDTNSNVNNKERAQTSKEKILEGNRLAYEKSLQRQASGEVDLSWLPEGLVHFGRAFLLAAGDTYNPTLRDRKLWKRELYEWSAIGYTDDIIARTVQKMKTQGLTIVGVQSITGMARSVMTSQGQGEFPPEFHASAEFIERNKAIYNK